MAVPRPRLQDPAPPLFLSISSTRHAGCHFNMPIQDLKKVIWHRLQKTLSLPPLFSKL